MGGQSSIQQAEKFENKIQFIQWIQDNNFGRIQIYRYMQAPYQYVIKYQKTFHEKQDNYQNYYSLMKKIKQKSHKNIVKLHHIEQKQEIFACIKNFKIFSYFNYYNFTLGTLIQKKKHIGSAFPQNQLLYVFSTLLSIGKYLKFQNISLGDYRTQQIFLTLQGHIKMYLLDQSTQNQHNSYFSALTSKQNLENHLLSPEQLAGIRKNNHKIQFDVYKSDIFSIAMILLQLICLDNQTVYYNYQNCQINFGKIKYNLASIKKSYSKQLLMLLHSCLQQNPNNRFSFQQANMYLDKFNKNIVISDSIKIINLQQNDLQTNKFINKEDNSRHRAFNSQIIDISKLTTIPQNTNGNTQMLKNHKKDIYLSRINSNIMYSSRTSTSSYEIKNKFQHK